MNYQHFYVVHERNDYHTFYRFEEAVEYYEHSDALMLMRKTKDLFPTYDIIDYRLQGSHNFMFIVNRKLLMTFGFGGSLGSPR